VAEAHPAPRPRAVQERSVRTRERILEAAVECLAEHGYSLTTTVKIQEIAGVSRGRLLHHFPSKEELLAAAVEHLATRNFDLLKEEARRFSNDERRIDQAVELLWSIFDTPFFWAAMELWVAARTDEQLRVALHHEERRLATVIPELAEALFGERYIDSPNFESVLSILVSSMRGEALTMAFAPDDARLEKRLSAWKLMAQELLQASSRS